MPRDVENFAKLDYGREARQGVPEVVLAADKTVGQCVAIVKNLLAELGRVFVTRVREDQYEVLIREIPAGHVDREARTFRVGQMTEREDVIGVICAGTSDVPVAAEARETLRFLGFAPEYFPDIGVAGPQRLQNRLGEIQRLDGLICAAGMEASLPTVLAAYVACPVVAVPVATDRERGWAGVPALLSMLSSCVPGVVVVNVDNGFGAACAIARMFPNRAKREIIL